MATVSITFIGFLQQQFENGTYDRIDALYMNYITAGRQRPKNLQLLPVLPDTFFDRWLCHYRSSLLV